MSRIPLVIIFALSLLADVSSAQERMNPPRPGESSAQARDEARIQAEFGILMAQKGLWNEAVYRWERAIAIDPGYAAALDNLAVAYEQQGLPEKARQAYERALALDPENASIQENFDRFEERHDRPSR